MLTAGAAQSLPGTNTVDTGDIIDRTIGTPDVKVGAFAGQTILDNSMTTLDINEATLVLTCPPGTTKLQDFCFGPEKPAATFQGAMQFCNTKGMHLPGLNEGTAIALPDIAEQVGESVLAEARRHLRQGVGVAAQLLEQGAAARQAFIVHAQGFSVGAPGLAAGAGRVSA